MRVCAVHQDLPEFTPNESASVGSPSENSSTLCACTSCAGAFLAQTHRPLRARTGTPAEGLLYALAKIGMLLFCRLHALLPIVFDRIHLAPDLKDLQFLGCPLCQLLLHQTPRPAVIPPIHPQHLARAGGAEEGGVQD